MEKYELVTKNSSEYFKKNTYKTIDSDGSVLVLRPDITPSVIRMFSNQKIEEPLKLYYITNSFRLDKTPREFWQAGAEIFTKNKEYDGEIISLSLEIMEKLGVEDFFIDIGNINFIKNVVKKFKISSDFIYDLEKGDLISAEMLLQKSKVSSVDLLKDLINLRGDGKKLYNFMEEINDKTLKKDLKDLIDIYEYLKDSGQEKKVIFDLGLVRKPTYYTNIIFEGYVPQIGKKLIGGGRYEYENVSGVGFAVDIDALINVVNTIKEKQEIILVEYTKNRKKALVTAKKLRKEGKIVYLLSETDKKKIGDFMKKKNAKKITVG